MCACSRTRAKASAQFAAYSAGLRAKPSARQCSVGCAPNRWLGRIGLGARGSAVQPFVHTFVGPVGLATNLAGSGQLGSQPAPLRAGRAGRIITRSCQPPRWRARQLQGRQQQQQPSTPPRARARPECSCQPARRGRQRRQQGAHDISAAERALCARSLPADTCSFPWLPSVSQQVGGRTGGRLLGGQAGAAAGSAETIQARRPLFRTRLPC